MRWKTLKDAYKHKYPMEEVRELEYFRSLLSEAGSSRQNPQAPPESTEEDGLNLQTGGRNAQALRYGVRQESILSTERPAKVHESDNKDGFSLEAGGTRKRKALVDDGQQGVIDSGGGTLEVPDTDVVHADMLKKKTELELKILTLQLKREEIQLQNIYEQQKLQSRNFSTQMATTIMGVEPSTSWASGVGFVNGALLQQPQQVAGIASSEWLNDETLFTPHSDWHNAGTT